MANDYDPLTYCRNELADAEGRLRNARDSLKKAAEAHGRSSGLFSETFFVPRATAERWVETAEQKFFEREKQNFEYVKEALGALAATTKAKDDSPGKRTDLEPNGGASRLPGDNNDTLHTANAIIAAGQRRRGESDAKPPTLTVVERPPARPQMTVVPGAPMPPKGSLAEKIILAGMRRRGEIE